jgi:hypothetical protein
VSLKETKTQLQQQGQGEEGEIDGRGDMRTQSCHEDSIFCIHDRIIK